MQTSIPILVQFLLIEFICIQARINSTRWGRPVCSVCIHTWLHTHTWTVFQDGEGSDAESWARVCCVFMTYVSIDIRVCMSYVCAYSVRLNAIVPSYLCTRFSRLSRSREGANMRIRLHHYWSIHNWLTGPQVHASSRSLNRIKTYLGSLRHTGEEICFRRISAKFSARVCYQTPTPTPLFFIVSITISTAIINRNTCRVAVKRSVVGDIIFL